MFQTFGQYLQNVWTDIQNKMVSWKEKIYRKTPNYLSFSFYTNYKITIDCSIYNENLGFGIKKSMYEQW